MYLIRYLPLSVHQSNQMQMVAYNVAPQVYTGSPIDSRVSKPNEFGALPPS